MTDAPIPRLSITPDVLDAAMKAFAEHPAHEQDGDVSGPGVAAVSAALIAKQRARLPVHDQVEAYPLDAFIWKRESTGEWVVDLSGSINDTGFFIRHTQPGDLPPEDAVGLPTHYALLDAAEKVLAGEPGALDTLAEQVARTQPAPVKMDELEAQA